MTIFAHLESGRRYSQGGCRQLLPYDVEYDDFSALTTGDFAYVILNLKLVISEMRCPVWFAVAPRLGKSNSIGS